MNALGLALALLQAPSATPAKPADYPFAVGERLTYSAKLGLLTLGSGSLEVAALDTVRGVESFRLRFRLQGKTIFYSLDDVLESSVGVKDFTSRRFMQDFLENEKRRHRQFEIFLIPASFASGDVIRHSRRRRIHSTTRPSFTSSAWRRWKWVKNTSTTAISGKRKIRLRSK